MISPGRGIGPGVARRKSVAPGTLGWMSTMVAVPLPSRCRMRVSWLSLAAPAVAGAANGSTRRSLKASRFTGSTVVGNI